MPDDFATHSSSLTAPAQHAVAVTPSDSVPLAAASRGIFVGQTGNLRAQMVGGEIVTFTNVQTGAFYPLRLAQVMATGTTATGLIALR